jgi:hypothetical protein
LAKNSIDVDNNGIPDYIDELKDPSNKDKIKDYAKNALKNYDKSLKKEEDTSILDDLGELNNKIDNVSSQIDNLVE